MDSSVCDSRSSSSPKVEENRSTVFDLEDEYGLRFLTSSRAAALVVIAVGTTIRQESNPFANHDNMRRKPCETDRIYIIYKELKYDRLHNDNYINIYKYIYIYI